MDAANIAEQLYANDMFSKWLGIQFMEVKKGFCRLKIIVRPEMCNGFGIAHGGISYSLADSALAFASNSSGRHSVSVETSISHTKKVSAGEVLFAVATEKKVGNAIGIYEVVITNEMGDPVALFKGTVYCTKPWQDE
jgi:acyl-CoA thioesterase